MFAKCHGQLLIGLAFALAMSVIAQAAPLACSGGKIQAGGECVDKEQAGSEIDKIVRKIMAENDLKAVIAGVAVDCKPVFAKAGGEAITGVRAPSDDGFIRELDNQCAVGWRIHVYV